MAVCKMVKFVVLSHGSEAADLLEALQEEGICQILDAEQGMVCKDWPELQCGVSPAKDIEDRLKRLEKSISFLGDYERKEGGLGKVLAPREVINEARYMEVVKESQGFSLVEQAERAADKIEDSRAEEERLSGVIEKLRPWMDLETPVDELSRMESACCFTGLIAEQKLSDIEEAAGESGWAVEEVGTVDRKTACLIVCLNEQAVELQKMLRSADFESVSFEGMSGTIKELTEENKRGLSEVQQELTKQQRLAGSLAGELSKLRILYDYYDNLLRREKAQGDSPWTDSTVVLEGWTREKDYGRLEDVVGHFEASSLNRTEKGQEEEIPVDIENKEVVKPFEVVTRLYGMPKYFDVDPTVFLAPFFAVFFALCLTDAGYGIAMVLLMAFFIKKMQGDKKLLWMLGICGVFTIGAGAVTGGWFGDAVQQLDIGWLNAARQKMMLFDPLEDPMMFFYLAIACGYIQIMAGLVIAFFHSLRQKDYTSALCDRLTWLVMLNSIVIYGASKSGMLPSSIGGYAGLTALFPAAIIFLFSERHGGWGSRLGIGAYNLFSTVFYVGDVLSYLRLMALGMVTAGLAMAINVIARIALDLPYGLGIVLMILILVGGHALNVALSALGAFVHTLRLQYAEFFPKFFTGGGRAFVPLSKEYKHIHLSKD